MTHSPLAESNTMTEPRLFVVPMSEIHMDESFNCRGKIIPMDVIDLSKDIEKNGLLQPVAIAPYSVEQQKETGFKYLLILGYRRFTAHKVLNRTEILCTLQPAMTEINARAVNLSENLQRVNLSLLQEAKAMQRLFELGVSEKDAAELLGMSRGWVQVRYMLLKLPEVLQEEIGVGKFSQIQVRDIYTHYSKGGLQAAVDTVRELKTKKVRGESIVRPKPVKVSTSKRMRKRSEIFEMMDLIREAIGNGLHTRALAWASGEITTGDLYYTLQQSAKEQGIDYIIPKD